MIPKRYLRRSTERTPLTVILTFLVLGLLALAAGIASVSPPAGLRAETEKPPKAMIESPTATPTRTNCTATTIESANMTLAQSTATPTETSTPIPTATPCQSMTRGQYAQLLALASGYTGPGYCPYTIANPPPYFPPPPPCTTYDPTSFSDVPLSNAFAGAIYYDVSHGLMSGYPDGTFRPYELINPCLVPTATATPIPEKLDLGIYRLDGTALPDADRNSVGSMVWVNDDNDNENGVPDMTEHPVAHEDDLIKVVAKRLQGASGEVELSFASGTGRVRVWSSPTKDREIVLPVSFTLDEGGSREFWVEGIEGSSSQRDVQFSLRSLSSNPPPASTITLTVLQFSSLSWVGRGNSVNNDDNLDDDRHTPQWADAKRVFPDARENGGAPRNKVSLEVQLNVAPVEDLDVFLRAFDIDDPSTSNQDPQLSVDPNDLDLSGSYPGTNIVYTPEEDNRGAVNGKKAGWIDGQDANGIAELTFPANTQENDTGFQVTMQPGDNFRVVAAGEAAYLQQLRNLDAQDHEQIFNSYTRQQVPASDSRVSSVLTVWRWLHLEFDSMAAPGNANTVHGFIRSVVRDGSVSVVNTDVTLAQDEQYICPASEFPAFCFLQVGYRKFRVLYNLNNPGGAGSAIRVANDPNGPPPRGQAFTLHDDDHDNILPRLPDISWMTDTDNVDTNLYAAAYIRPRVDGGGNPSNEQLNLPFRVNIGYDLTDDEAAARAAIAVGKQATGNADFWVSYVQSAFQGPLLDDRDPDPQDRVVTAAEQGVLGITPGWGDGSVVYQEPITDLARDPRVIANLVSREDIERATVLHEVTHQFRAMHRCPGIMCGDWPTESPIQKMIDDRSLNAIRSTLRPGGGFVGGNP